MAEKLGDEEISTICMYMRIVDLFKNNPDIVEKTPGLKENFEILCTQVGEIMELLTDEQRDELLEEHKLQWEEMLAATKKAE